MTYEKYAKIRDSLGLNDSKVSQLTGIYKSTFSDWKNGKSVPKMDKMKKIANVLGVDLNEFASDADWDMDFIATNPILQKAIEIKEKESRYAILIDLYENDDDFRTLLRLSKYAKALGLNKKGGDNNDN